MKILILSNAYPPYITGGYEIACFDNVQRLREKGHEIRVLTSNYRKYETNPQDNDSNVFRELTLLQEFYQFKPVLLKNKILRRVMAFFLNQYTIRKHLLQFKPDIIFGWNLGAISPSILIPARKKCPVVLYLSDMWYWAAYSSAWRLFGSKFKNGISARLPASWKSISTEDDFILCSRALLEEYRALNIPLQKTSIIYHGVNTADFYPLEHVPPQKNCFKILFSGRLIEIKGPETVLHAIHLLINQYHQTHVKLTLVGEGDPVYLESLHEKVQKWGISSFVEFIPPVPRISLRDIYISHHVLVFPSLWKEPFSITILEAMSCGLPIVGTTTGGSREILKNAENSLVFEAGNANQLAEQLNHLIQEPELRMKIRKNALNTIKEYTLNRMAENIENHLIHVIQNTNKKG